MEQHVSQFKYKWKFNCSLHVLESLLFNCHVGMIAQPMAPWRVLTWGMLWCNWAHVWNIITASCKLMLELVAIMYVCVFLSVMCTDIGCSKCPWICGLMIFHCSSKHYVAQ